MMKVVSNFTVLIGIVFLIFLIQTVAAEQIYIPGTSEGGVLYAAQQSGTCSIVGDWSQSSFPGCINYCHADGTCSQTIYTGDTYEGPHTGTWVQTGNAATIYWNFRSVGRPSNYIDYNTISDDCNSYTGVNNYGDGFTGTRITAPENQPPVAHAGTDQTVTIGTPVTLDGTGSSDPDNNLPLTYTWSMSAPSGSTATLSSTTAARPTFTPDKTGDYVITLTVHDSLGLASTGADSVTITVTSQPPEIHILDARMISPNELGIGITVKFPVGTPTDALKKARFTANINGKDVDVEFPITATNNGQITFIGLDSNNKVNSRTTPLKINLQTQNIPRFTENIKFSLNGETYYEGGPHSLQTSDSQKEITILLPVLLIHGYRMEHTVSGQLFFVPLTRFAYDPLITSLKENGYTEDRSSGYRTLYAPKDIEYNALRETPESITLRVNRWVETAKKNSYADKVNLIGHCLGGLVIRNYAGDPVAKTNGISKVNKVIMIAAPHQGETFFFQQTFEKSAKDAQKLIRVPGSNQNNILLWGVPTYSALIDQSGKSVQYPNGFTNTYAPLYNPDVKYLNIVAEGKDTPFQLTVQRTRDNWYKIIGQPSYADGDDSVLSTSADVPIFTNKRIVSAVGLVSGHGFICRNQWVIDYTTGFLE